MAKNCPGLVRYGKEGHWVSKKAGHQIRWVRLPTACAFRMYECMTGNLVRFNYRYFEYCLDKLKRKLDVEGTARFVYGKVSLLELETKMELLMEEDQRPWPAWPAADDSWIQDDGHYATDGLPDLLAVAYPHLHPLELGTLQIGRAHV